MAYPLLRTCWHGSRSIAICGALVAAAVAAGSGGCLYTDPINRPPMITIHIEPPSTEVLKGDEVTFRAEASDPDNDRFMVEWATDTRRCPPAVVNYENPNSWPTLRSSTGESVVFGAPVTNDSFCVWAFATDRLGAVKVAAPYQVDPTNPRPRARIELVDRDDTLSEFSLYDDLVFAGDGSVGAQTYSWHLTSPPGSSLTSGQLGCPNGEPNLACLSADRPGEYSIQLEVTDGAGVVSAPELRKVRILEDRLPCIAMTEPGLAAMTVAQDQAQARVLSVTQVDDDGDPFPSPMPMPPRFGTPELRWFKGIGPGKPAYVQSNVFDFTLAAGEFSLGDEVTVRVEVRDRNKQRVDLILAGCGDQPTCGETPSCLQRVTWTIKYVL